MPLTLYYSPYSQPSRAVWWFLMLNEIPFEGKVMQFTEIRTPEFIALNPFHTLPTVKDGDTVVYESNAIVYYLREKYNDKANLLPQTGDLMSRTRMTAFLSWYPSGLRTPFVAYIFNVLIGPKRMGMPAPSEETQKAMLAKLHEALKNVNDHWVNKAGYIAGGDMPTMADLQCYSEIEQLRFYPNFDWSAYPNVQRYREHMSHVPHCAEIFAPLLAFSSP